MRYVEGAVLKLPEGNGVPFTFHIRFAAHREAVRWEVQEPQVPAGVWGKAPSVSQKGDYE